ncbi:hypothetical protein [Labrys sp. ZIDIC5]|uniref:hypothetical protein n=1 Tax=Labrys sedimenti TaxID=3106036 RepID=UPI002ACA64D1|nr:hypothetical protein [Labrys sp. ZIDIC5]MDZ5453501.1 hypothetical protein [Labrys sp. ZIDIC5]
MGTQSAITNEFKPPAIILRHHESGAMHKHIAIIAALDYLRDRLGHQFFQLADHWEGDHMAIGIASPNDASRLVYIACTDTLSPVYTAILERESSPDDEIPYEECGSFDGLDIEGLTDVVSAHLQH